MFLNGVTNEQRTYPDHRRDQRHQGRFHDLAVGSLDQISVIDAVTNIAAIGISLNPAKKQAYLVPRDGRICLDISYMGLMDLAMATGSIKWAQAALVHEDDVFVLNGSTSRRRTTFALLHEPRRHRRRVCGRQDGGRRVPDAHDGHRQRLRIRDRSEAWKKSKSGPWKTDEGEMIKKTCVKQAYKYWPKTERLEQAIHHLNTDGGEGLTDCNA
jgi:recombination protein RecT